MQPSGRPRKIVRISDFSCGAEAVPASTPQAKRSKQKARRVQGTPYLDLRKMVSSKRANEPNLDYEALDASGARKIAYVVASFFWIAVVDVGSRSVLRLRNCAVPWRAQATTVLEPLFVSPWTYYAISLWKMLCGSSLVNFTMARNSDAGSSPKNL